MNQLIKNKIQKQLLNFDQDIEFDKFNSVQKKINNFIKSTKWLLENTVDLGLPSGTRWMKYNVGATCGARSESWHGNYYAWGETETKPQYGWNDYKLARYSYTNSHNVDDQLIFLKYNDKDYINLLQPIDDIAFLSADKKSNGQISMATNYQWQELINETTHKWISHNYNNIIGLTGMLFIGKNKNTLFIPAGGAFVNNNVIAKNTNCFYWTKSINNQLMAFSFYGNNKRLGISENNRGAGLNIRGVCDNF